MIKVHLADGETFTATSVRPISCNAGRGYRIVRDDHDNTIMFFKTSEVLDIVPMKGE